ncbi:hypothetical protein EDC04DRAFT_1991898 [Pisolithus marmoratus]|nr:hypothetical protein EDC04DRAFT_1991898 [Pisolithus marmoratus]
MTLRVYALYVKSRRVLLFLVSVALAAVGVACVSGPFYHPRLRQLHLYQPLRCAMDAMSPSPMNSTAIAWGGQMSCDAIVFILTLWRTLRVGRLGKRTLLDVLIRDGVLYFGLMTVINEIVPCGVYQRHILNYDISPHAQPP